MCSTFAPVLSSNGFSSFAITSFSSVPNGAFANWSVTPSNGFARLVRLILGAAAAFPASAPATGSPTATPAAFLRNSRRLCAAGSGFGSVGSAIPAAFTQIVHSNLLLHTDWPDARAGAHIRASLLAGEASGAILGTYMQRIQLSSSAAYRL